MVARRRVVVDTGGSSRQGRWRLCKCLKDMPICVVEGNPCVGFTRTDFTNCGHDMAMGVANTNCNETVHTTPNQRSLQDG